MGRKIPGKKHRGVKDPEKQRAKRFAQLKTVINAPPEDTEEQAIPKSLKHLMKLKEDVKAGKIGKIKNRKKKRKNGLIVLSNKNFNPSHPNARPDKVIPILSQKPGESTDEFLNRVDSETQAFLNEVSLEKKFGVDVKRNSQTGEIEGLSNKPKDEIDELTKLKMKHKNINRKKKKVTESEVRLTKSQKKRQKLEMKKQKKLQSNIDEFEIFKEKVEFGEIVHAPPVLKVRPKKASTIQSSKKDLLLNSLFDKDEGMKHGSSRFGTIDRTGKRKDLPIGERRQLEKQQNDAIAAYRMLKLRKSSTL